MNAYGQGLESYHHDFLSSQFMIVSTIISINESLSFCCSTFFLKGGCPVHQRGAMLVVNRIRLLCVEIFFT